MKKGLLILGLAFAATSLADADCNHRVVVRQHHVVEAALIAVPVPLYQVVYNQGGPQEDIERLKMELTIVKLLARVQDLERQMKAPLPQKGQFKEPEIEKPAPKQLSLGATHCASCHDRQREKGVPQFYTDGVFTGTAEDRLDMVAAVLSSRMPKGKQISDETASQLMAELSARQTVKKGI